MADQSKALELVRKLITEGENPTEDKFSAVWDATALRDWYAGCQRLSGYLDKDSPFKKDLATRPDAKNLWDEDAHATMLACLKQVEEDLAPADVAFGTSAVEGQGRDEQTCCRPRQSESKPPRQRWQRTPQDRRPRSRGEGRRRA